MTSIAKFSLALIGALILTVAGGCATVDAPADRTVVDFKGRAVSQRDGNVRVSTSVLSAEESRELYGFPLAENGIQPVWIEVENGDELAYWLLSLGLDPNFFPASEVADLYARDGPGAAEIEQRFRQLAWRNPVPPGATVSGVVLTNLDEGVKLVQLDLVADGRMKTFALFNFIPGFRADFASKETRLADLYPADAIIDYATDDKLRTALEQLPCCVTNKSGSRDGDPLNLVIIGSVQDAFPALVRRGWRPTEQTWFGSVTKMMSSALFGERYRYAPVSPLYLYGRPQDLAMQKARDNIHQRNHLRLWRAPMLYRGKQVWVGQISRDIGSRLTIHSPYLTTHKIDPDVDEARSALTEDMAYSQNLSAIGLVGGVGAAPKSAPRGNLTTDPYYTDGLRVVLIFDVRPTSLADIDVLPWEGRQGGFVEQSVKRTAQ
ncbi:MAG: LssY C-terminal domain-containing protein [Chromatiaceae bacterium]|nr:LssY C-terminal domain-containing protein [Chromatiaceae bacterium]